MRCVICKQDETRAGVTTVTLERDSVTLVVQGVPAHVCRNCGEAYVDEEIGRKLIKSAEEAARAGAQVQIRQYAAA
jgi:YgiT-type zinc finger domain-containing protein